MKTVACTLAAALLAATALTSPARAEAPDANTPRASGVDQNMREVDYDPRARFRIVGTVGRDTIFTFAPDEQIIRVIVGDRGDTWQVPDPAAIKESPLRNVLFLRPSNPGYTTVQVITESDDTTKPPRTYQFAAEARHLPASCAGRVVCDDPAATYGLTFRYPADEAAARAAQVKAEAEERRRRREVEAPLRQANAARAHLASMRGRLEVDHFAGGPCRVWEYDGQANEAGRARIVPDKVTDNGQETALSFEGNKEVPAFYILASDLKTETPIIPTKRGPDVFVLHAVAPHQPEGLEPAAGQIRMRRGDAVVFLYRRADLPASCVSQTGTNSPDVARVLRQPTLRRAVAQ